MDTERMKETAKKLREKESKYNRDLLDEAADAIESLLAEKENEKCD